MRNRVIWLMIATLFLPTIIQPQADSPTKPLPTVDVAFVSPVKHPQPPDYAAIKLASDERLAVEKACVDKGGHLEASGCALPPPPSTYAPPTATSVPAASGDVTAAIVKWANYYGVDPAWLLRVSNCESGYNQAATNYSYYAGGGNPTGIFQFLPQTFYANAARVGVTSPDLGNYDQQAQVAAWMFSIGQWVQWECR